MSLSEDPMWGHMLGSVVSRDRENNQLKNQLSETKDSSKRLATASIDAQIESSNAMVTAVKSVMNMTDTIDSLRAEIKDLEESDGGYWYALAGVRGVTRELLAELRKTDPNNPLLDKGVRDKIFSSVADRLDKDKVENQKTWRQRDKESPKVRDEILGGENSYRGGPEKSDISPNLAVRGEAGVPEHVNEREKFLGLLARLYDEVKSNNPSSPILSDKAMISAFEEYTLKSRSQKEKD